MKALADYSQDSDEEALFKEVALGYLFLGVGKAVEKGFKMLKGSGVVDEVAQKLKETRALLKKKKFVRVVQKWGGELVESIEHKGVRYVEAADDPKVLDQAVALASRGDDLPRIADNLADELGLSGAAKDKLARQLAEVKEHYWKGEHLVEFEQGKFRVGRFSKEAHDIQLWEAAENGFKNKEQLREFKKFIAHEYTELKLMEEGLPYRGMDTSNWDEIFGNVPTSSSYGAHDLAPTLNGIGGDFGPWHSKLGRNIPEDLMVKDDLSNLDELVEIIKNIEGFN